MAHQIYSNNDMFSVKEVPWHGLGRVIEEAPTSEEALKLAGLDWTVKQEPVLIRNKYGTTNLGSLEAVEPYLFNVRSDNGLVLGLVTKSYHVVQNNEAFRFVDELIGTGEVKYETAGCLKGGKRVWLLARLPEHRILGDVVEPFLCYTHGHDGLTPVKAIITPIRVVCNNTLSFALGTAQRSWVTKHYAGVNDKLDEAKITLGLVNDYMSNLARLADELATKKLEEHKVVSLLEKLFPVSDEASLRQQANKFSLREGVFDIYKDTPDLADYRGTGWGFVGAVADFVTHAVPQRKTKNFEEQRFANLLDGKTKLDMAVELVRAA